MADPLSIVAGAAGLADICIRVIHGIHQLKTDADNIDGQLDVLAQEVEGLREICDMIQTTLEANNHDYSDQKHITGSSGNPRTRMSRTLTKAREVVTNLEGIVRKVSGAHDSISNRDRGRLEAYRTALRKLLHESDLRNCRIQLAAHQKTLHLYLSIMTHQDMSEFSEKIQDMSYDIQSYLTDLQESNKSTANFHYDAAALKALQELREAVDSTSTTIQTVSSNQHFDIPQSVSSLFSGREIELRDLGNLLLKQTPTINRRDNNKKTAQGQRRFVIYGLGGSGKTQFCSKFAQDNQNSFWGVFWIDASTPERLKQTLGTIATIAGREKTENAALHWLSTLETRWLLIIDNADDPDIQLERYFPKGNRGNILVTTRNPAYKVHGNVGPGFFYFGGLRAKEAVHLLLKASAEPAPWDDAREALAETINKKLGSLALAIIHAGAAVRSKLCSLKDYLAYYSRMLKRIRSEKIEIKKGMDVAIFTTWEICYERLEERKTKAAVDAMQLLNTFAFFHRESISPDILTRAMTNAQREEEAGKKQAESDKGSDGGGASTTSWRTATLSFLLSHTPGTRPSPLPAVIRTGRHPSNLEESQDRINSALKELLEMSLVTYNDLSETYSMHPIVHTWARERPRMTLADQALWADVAGRVLASSILLPSANPTSEDERFQVSLLPHVEHVQLCREQIAGQLVGKAKVEQGWLSRLMSFIPVPGLGDTDRILMFAKFAVVYGRCGQFARAEVLLVQVVDFLNRYLGRNHKRSRDTTRHLASMYFHMGRMEDAARVQGDLVRICKVHLGAEHTDTLRAEGDLGRVYWQQGRLTEARKLQGKVLDNMRGVLQGDHEDLLDVMDRLGSTCLRLWDFGESYRLHRGAMEGMERVFGGAHLRTLEARENMCRAAVMLLPEEVAGGLMGEEIGEVRRRAPEIMRQVLKVRKADLGKENPYTLLAMVNLAIILSAAGRLREAEELVLRGLPVAERNLGHEHLGTMLGRQVLAGILLEQGRCEEAEGVLLLLTEAQGRIESPRGKFHPDRLGSLIELARCLFMLGRIERAIEVCEECIGGFEANGAGGHPLADWMRKVRGRMEDLVECKSPVYEVDRRPERHEIVFPGILFASDGGGGGGSSSGW